jgi:type IV pilus assembly protein PilY1
VADYGGQVWTVRFWVPGKRSSGGRVENWFAARAFQVKASDAQAVRPSFSFMTSNTLQPDTGYLRTFIGTGDRYNLADGGGTTCRLSNPLGCAQLGCRASQTVTVERAGTPAWSSSTSYAEYLNTSGTPTPGTAGGTCGSTKVSLAWNYGADNGCGASSTGRLEYTCDGTGASWGCRVTQNDWESLAATKPLPATSPHRFYGFWSYGVKKARTFNTPSEARAYEAGLLTDDSLVDVSQFDTTGKVTGDKEAGALEAGWYVRYSAPREQTGSGTTIVNGCVLWNSFEAGASSGMCAASGDHKARIYQAGFVGGAAHCAEGFYTASTGGGTGGSGTWQRFGERSVMSAPADPAPQRGLQTVDIVLNEPGTGPRRVGVALENEALQSLYQLELDRSGHDCRHEDERCE